MSKVLPNFSKLNLQNLVNEMRNSNKYKVMCEKENKILPKCILCKRYLSSNQYGPLLEKFIVNKLNLSKPPDNTSGDASFNNKNIEIKVSLGDKRGILSFVQLRPDHNIDYYLLLTYDLAFGDIGQVNMFNVPSNDMNKLIVKYGNYAHGTVKKLGKITSSNIKGRNCEYALRTIPNNKKQIGKLWKDLIKNYLCTFDTIKFT